LKKAQTEPVKDWLIVHKDIICKAFAPETWSAWALVFVGVVAALVAWRTLKAIHHEATTAKDIAQAAMLNTKAIINSERAWLVVTIEADEGKQNTYKVTVLNQGRTPAKIIGGDSEYRFIDLPDNLPIPPVYDVPFTMPNQTFIVNRDSFSIRPFLMPEQIIKNSEIKTMEAMIAQSQQFLMFYGRIIYEDTFTEARPQSVRHETRWCFAYISQAREFRSCGPNDYRGHCDHEN
jgi:hypothetical protein